MEYRIESRDEPPSHSLMKVTDANWHEIPAGCLEIAKPQEHDWLVSWTFIVHSPMIGEGI